MNAPFRVPTSTLTLLISLSLLGFDKNSHDCPGCIRLSWAQFVSTWVVKPSLEKLHQPQALSFWDHKFRQARGEYLTPMSASSRTPMFWGPSWTPRRELYYRNLQMQRGRGCLLISGAAQQPETANECICKISRFWQAVIQRRGGGPLTSPAPPETAPLAAVPVDYSGSAFSKACFKSLRWVHAYRGGYPATAAPGVRLSAKPH